MIPLNNLLATEGVDLLEANRAAPHEMQKSMADLAALAVNAVALAALQAEAAAKLAVKQEAAKAVELVALAVITAAEIAERAAVAAATKALVAVGKAAKLALECATRASATIAAAVAEAKNAVTQNAANAADAVALAVQRASDIAEENATRVAKLAAVEMKAAVSQLRISEGRREQAEETRAELEVQLRESQKMEAMGILAGGIAHDFNNILATIRGNTVLAKQDIIANRGEALLSLEQIDKAATRAVTLVQQILTFSRRNVQTLTVQPLQAVLNESVELQRAAIPVGVSVEANCGDALLYVRCDKTQLEQLIINLCTNAWHAMDGSSGRIELGLREVILDVAAALAFHDLRAGRYVCLTVSDDGHGMDEATQRRIFEPFFTTKGVGKGTGLGLSVVHGIVKTHKGAIKVESTPGKGTTLEVYLPLADAPQWATSFPINFSQAVSDIRPDLRAEIGSA